MRNRVELVGEEISKAPPVSYNVAENKTHPKGVKGGACGNCGASEKAGGLRLAFLALV